jgi:hypothetical protein
MKKIKYFYNTHTLRFEKLITPLRVKLLRIFGIVSALVVSSSLVIWLYLKFVPRPQDKMIVYRLNTLKEDYKNLSEKLKTLEDEMALLEKRDNEVYRSIFEANPLPDSARAKLTESKKEFENSIPNKGLAVAKLVNFLEAFAWV